MDNKNSQNYNRNAKKFFGRDIKPYTSDLKPVSNYKGLG